MIGKDMVDPTPLTPQNWTFPPTMPGSVKVWFEFYNDFYSNQGSQGHVPPGFKHMMAKHANAWRKFLTEKSQTGERWTKLDDATAEALHIKGVAFMAAYEDLTKASVQAFEKLGSRFKHWHVAVPMVSSAVGLALGYHFGRTGF